jgi:hypothetical protein
MNYYPSAEESALEFQKIVQYFSNSPIDSLGVSPISWQTAEGSKAGFSPAS